MSKTNPLKPGEGRFTEVNVPFEEPKKKKSQEQLEREAKLLSRKAGFEWTFEDSDE